MKCALTESAETERKGEIVLNTLKAGFSRVDITPMTGIPIRGYYKKRFAEGVLDPLEADVLAVGCGEDPVVLISVDNCGFETETMTWIRKRIGEKCGIPEENIFLSCTHTHTGPYIHKPDMAPKKPGKQQDHHEADAGHPLVAEYTEFAAGRLEDAAVYAIQDMKEARAGLGSGSAPNVAFIRRYVMKNGEIRTNPGVGNPEIDHPCGEVDERVHVLRFDRKDADTIVLVNFGNHPDVVGGSLISADWPGFLRRRVEQALPGTRCIFFNGAQGDVNHVNVFPRGGDLNDMFLDFDDVSRGYGHARHIGNVVTGAVLQAYDKVEYRDTEKTGSRVITVRVPSNRPRPEDMPEARRIAELHAEGRDDEIPYTGMMLTTAVAEAERMILLENGPDWFEMPLSAVRIGDIALIGLPGEPFTGIGRELKKNKNWAAVLPCCLTNGGEGYFPMMDAYEEGGYESRGSRFKAGVAEYLIREGNGLLDRVAEE